MGNAVWMLGIALLQPLLVGGGVLLSVPLEISHRPWSPSRKDSAAEEFLSVVSSGNFSAGSSSLQLRALNSEAAALSDVPSEAFRNRRARSTGDDLVALFGREHLAGDAVEVQLKDQFDLLYTARADVGKPPASVRLIVDTGSSDIWLKSDEVSSQYSLPASKTASTLPGSAIQLKYGIGSVDGMEIKDRICLGSLCSKEQNFILALGVQDIGELSSFEGLLGLAFPVLAKDRAGKTFLEELSEDSRFSNLGFTLALHSEEEAKPSILTFGEVEELISRAEREAKSEGVTLPVFGIHYQATYWLVRMQLSVAPQGASEKQEGFPVLAADLFGVLDSGTSLMAVPQRVFVDIMIALFQKQTHDKCSFRLPGAEGQFLCLCDEAKTNDLTLAFEGLDRKRLEVVLTWRDLLVPAGQTSTGKRLCRVGIMPSPSTLPFMILGDVFLRKVHAIHDANRFLVTLVPDKNSGGTVIPAPLAGWLTLIGDAGMTPVFSAGAWSLTLVFALSAFRAISRQRSQASLDVESAEYTRL
eukprot:TRINITY_DN60649_c0_g1_i1.p1 TRINITY_DN60649_c0_g1~~TRINITY_DN60649_c0_g1_i1.p1  ORF type:complete len:545 (+),score=99.71 TRINITY_DN60649_c0_g1_i1:54-1637(+)